MVKQISSLNIKPIKTYTDGKKRKTTITEFKSVLEKQTKKTSALKSGVQGVQNNNTAKKSSASAASEDKKVSSAGNDVLFKEPITGRQVRYVDVADKSASSSASSKTSSAKKSSAVAAATTASSMKKTKYDAYFKQAARKYNVSESLLKAIARAESDFNANCVSSAGAVGVMQLMPETAKGLGVKNSYDPEQNIMGGAKCISLKLKEFNGDVRLALAAYNAGSGAVRRNGGVPSYCKTYINKVLSYKEAFETANAVG